MERSLPKWKPGRYSTVMPDSSTPQSPALPQPGERVMRRDRFQEAAFWIFGAFLALQLLFLAWLDVWK